MKTSDVNKTSRFCVGEGEHTTKREIVSSVFVSILAGIAYTEMFTPVRDSVRSADGLLWSTFLLVAAFFFVSMRFFIGNQLHLLNKKTLELRGNLWLFDFLWITAEFVIICFLAGLPTAKLNRDVPIDFYDLLGLLLIIDIAWPLFQWLMGFVWRQEWKRPLIAWQWGVLNALVLIVLWLIRESMYDPYGTGALSLVVALNIVAFVVDIVWIDEYDFI